MVDVELLPATPRRRRLGSHRILATRHLSVAPLYVEASRPRVEGDGVARLHNCERTTGGGLGRHVQHHRSVRRPAHARITDPDHVADAALQQLAWKRHVAHLGHPWIADGPATAQDHDGGLVDVEVWVIEPRVQIFDAIEDNCLSRMPEQRHRGCGWLDDCAVGTEVSSKNHDPCGLLQWLVEWADDI